MRKTLLGLAMLGIAAAPAIAQTTPAPGGDGATVQGTPPARTAPAGRDATTGTNTTTPPAVTTDEGTRRAAAPVPGANSFTEGQARSRIEAAGFTDVTGLAKDDQGIWRGQAMHNGQRAPVALDFQGNVTSPTH